MNRRAFCCGCGATLAAGCLSDDPTSEDTTATPATEPTQDTTERAAHPDNPYGKETLVVGIDETGADRDVRPLVEQALSYWETNAGRYVGYPIEYDLQPENPRPDVRITFQRQITSCGISGSATTLGCAHIITEPVDGGTVPVQIEAGYTDASTLHILKHELGHTLGLDHDDEPEDIMRADIAVIPDPVDVEIVWQTDSHDRETVRKQVEHGVAYYEDWSREHMADVVTIGEIREREDRVTGNREFVVIVEDDREACGDGGEYVSCGGVVEHETLGVELELTLADPRENIVGWLVGDAFADFLYLEGDDRPAVFDEFDWTTAGTAWWLE